MELAKIRHEIENVKKGGAGYSHASGFSIGESEQDKLKKQLNNLNEKYEDEKQRKEATEKEQDAEVETTAKELEELGENELKQRTRMSELQNELQQTIKRIETLQRGGG